MLNEKCVLLLSVFLFYLNKYLKNKKMQLRDVEANNATTLQPVEAPGSVCQKMARNRLPIYIKPSKCCFWVNLKLSSTVIA